MPPKNKTFRIDLPNSTSPFIEKILFNPLIGFIFSSFQCMALNEKLRPPPTKNWVRTHIKKSGVEKIIVTFKSFK